MNRWLGRTIVACLVLTGCSGGGASGGAAGPAAAADVSPPSDAGAAAVQTPTDAAADPDADLASVAQDPYCVATLTYGQQCEGVAASCRRAQLAQCANEKNIYSAAYQRAVVACAPDASCSGTKLDACETAAILGETRTALEESIREHYCAACDPTLLPECESAFYDPASLQPPSGAGFLVLELSVALQAEVATKCIGPAMTQGAPSCVSAFEQCLDGIYSPAALAAHVACP